MAQRLRLGCEQPVERRRVDFGAFEFCPGVAVGVGGVDAANQVARQPALFLEPVERFEGRRGDDAAEIEDDMRIRSEEHTSELQSLMRISYAVFCLQKNKHE